MTLSLIIPCLNEETRLPVTLGQIRAFRDAWKGSWSICEVIVVDDGSTDRTVETASAWGNRLPMVVLKHPHNRGKGAALRRGVQAAHGDFVLLYDADGATPIGEVEKLIAALERAQATIAIGSRVLIGEAGEVRMEHHRRFIGRVYYWLTASLIPGIHDAACGCKLFRRDRAQCLFALQHIDRFAYDPEILSLAIRFGDRIVEVPVRWNAIAGSKVNLFSDGIEMFWRVMGIYWRRMRDGTKKAK
ncbi:MAG: dolichyl-phosphate beta-glucosyltransferase [Candidatus Peregrinibacteria bacterium]